MNTSVIRYYLAYRFYQWQKQHSPTKAPEHIIAEFNEAIAASALIIFNKPELGIDEITRHAAYKPEGCLQSLILTETYQKKSFKKKFDESLAMVQSALAGSSLNESLFKDLLNCMKFLFFKSCTLPSFDPTIITLLYEIMILRACLSTAPPLLDRVITEIAPFAPYARPDYLMLYKSQSTYLGHRLLEEARLLPHETVEQSDKKKDELAVAAYWLGDEPHWPAQLAVEAASIILPINIQRLLVSRQSY